MSLQSYILNQTPLWFQNFTISLYNTYLYKRRHKGNYGTLKKFYSEAFYFDEKKIAEDISIIKEDFLEFSTTRSNWFTRYKNKPLESFPFLNKDDLINNLSEIATLHENKGVVSLTGGTTGASLKVIYTPEDIVERQAILDSFRGMYDYSLGKKTAWFSGKSIVSDKDIKNGNCYRDDWFNKIRFFSTFYIFENNFKIYWKALEDFSPEYIVGFPSSLFDICQVAYTRGLKFQGNIKVFFPTAESMLEEQKKVIQSVLGCAIVDQYASSEGAPFIIECPKGKLHINPYTGVFEVIDERGSPTQEGELVVTAFHTHGTPLIRYKIGDRIKLSEIGTKCDCGSSFPLVDKIIGRNNDYIWSNERGRVNLGNISNCTKDVNGILRFQVIQNETASITVKMITTNLYKNDDEKQFIRNMQDRVGNAMAINILKVDTIPREKSGKYSLIKNNIKAGLSISE